MLRPAGFLRSFGHALSGLRLVLSTQQNARIHLVATIGVIGTGLYVGLSFFDWRWIVLVIALVWIAEIINTALEHLCDIVHPGLHATVKAAKDMAAGAVFVASCAAAAIGLLVFLPYMGLPL